MMPVKLLYMMSLCMTSLCGAVKIQTYNAALLTNTGKYNVRKPNVIRALKNGDYDVMCLQEVWYGSDLAMLKKNLNKSVFVYTPPLFQERMLFGLIKAPPCHKAELTLACIVLKCAFLADDYAALVNCTVDCGMMSENQGCISCLVISGWNALRCFNYLRREAINIPGIVLLSKRKVNAIKTVYFEPNVKQITKRAYIEAEIEGVGTVFCSHSTSNSNSEFYEPNLRDVYASVEEQNLADSRKLTEAASQSSRPLIIGDLNTSPEVPAFNVSADFEGSYNHFLSEGFSSPYVSLVGRCTFCRRENPLVKPENENYLLDHVLIRNHTVLSAKRIYDQNIPNEDFPMSDHYGVEVEIGN